jgi:putative ATP-binding cassette transporter
MAFSQLLGAFSLIITQFQSLSSFAAVIARLGTLAERIEHSEIEKPIVIVESSDQVAYERLTLRSPTDGHLLLRDLTVSVSSGTRVLILAADVNSGVALFRATADMWEAGEGRILRPPNSDMLFLPEHSYLPPGTLRDAVVHTSQEGKISDAQIVAEMHRLGLDGVLERVGGLGGEKDWDDVLSLAEQQLLSVARLLIAPPKFAFLDRLGTALEPDELSMALKLLAEHGITYLVFEKTAGDITRYDAILQLGDNGAWQWRTTPVLKAVQ